MLMLHKRSRYTFALNIARSDIFTQHSTFNSCTCKCFAVATSLRKSSVEIKVLFKFIPVNHAKNFSGTFWYSFPVSPKCRCSQRLVGMQSICGLEIQFSTKLGVQTPHYEIFWLKIPKNKRPKTEKSLTMLSRRFFDSPIQITFTAYVTADMPWNSRYDGKALVTFSCTYELTDKLPNNRSKTWRLRACNRQFS